MVVLGVLLMLFVFDYLIFVAARSTISTFQGYKEMTQLNVDGNYISNLDTSSNANMGEFEKQDTQNVYDYLDKNFSYALYTDGFVVPLSNTYDMEVSIAYLNKEYYNLNTQFEISQGQRLNFDYNFHNEMEIPILVGKGLSASYPIGSKIEIDDPALQKAVTLNVVGVLTENVYHSNIYALSSKQYYNFSIILPVNEEFIANSNLGLQVQGLMDIVLLETTNDKVQDASKVIQDNLGFKLNFRTQQENTDYFNAYYFSSLKIIATITAISIIILTCLSIWSALLSIRLMIKEFTINLFVGLSYSRLRKILYGYYGILFSINLVALFAITAYSRYGNWIRKDASFATFGLFGVIDMDWFALVVVILTDIMIGILIVEIMLLKIKKIPISLGVLQ